MYGEFYGSLIWALLMLLHMVLPVLLIILAVTLGAGLWSRMKEKKGFCGGAPDSILRGRYASGDMRKNFSE